MRTAREKEPAERETTSIQVPRDFARQLGVIADHRGITRLEAVEKYLRPIILREHQKAVTEMHRELGGEG